MIFRAVWLSPLILLGLSSSAIEAQEAANEGLIKMVVGFLNGDDDDIRALAFNQIRSSAPGEAATRTFAEQLNALPEKSKVGLLSALADRGDQVAKPAILRVLETTKASSVRDSAITAIGQLGDASDCPALIQYISDGDDSAKAASRQSLITLQGDGVSDAIITGLNQSSTPVQVALIDVLTSRRAFDAIPTLMIYAVRDDAIVRAAAMNALGAIGNEKHVSGMARGILKAVPGKERSNAEKQLMFVCMRIEDPDKRAEPLLAAMESLPQRSRVALLSTLGRIGGPKARAEIEKAYNNPSATLHDAGLRALANWPDASIADKLISIAKNDEHAGHRRIARMSLLRIAPLPDGRTDEEKLDLLKSAMEMTVNDAEVSYALKRAAAIRLPETLRFVLPFLQQDKHAEQACLTIVELAHHRQLRDDNKEEFHAALDQVIEIAKDPVVVDRANRYKTGKTWVRPK